MGRIVNEWVPTVGLLGCEFRKIVKPMTDMVFGGSAHELGSFGLMNRIYTHLANETIKELMSGKKIKIYSDIPDIIEAISDIQSDGFYPTDILFSPKARYELLKSPMFISGYPQLDISDGGKFYDLNVTVNDTYDWGDILGIVYDKSQVIHKHKIAEGNDRNYIRATVSYVDVLAHENAAIVIKKNTANKMTWWKE